MAFWNRKKTPPPEPDGVTNPYIAFEIIDGVHLEISIGWPPDGDIKPFARMLAYLNSGDIIAPQLEEAALYANSVNQPEKAMIIHAALDGLASGKKKGVVSPDRPLVPPSKVIPTQMKNYSR